MARPRQDGTPAREVNRRKLTDLFVSSRKAQERAELIWDVKQPGLALSVRPTGKKAWKVIYRHHGRPRWLHLGDVRKIGLADARRLAAKIMLDVIEGKDPAAERRAERLTGTFADLAAQYVELHAMKHNKSWKQADALVRRHLLPRWGKLKASAITRADVRAVMVRIEAPIVANQMLAAALGDLLVGDPSGDPHRQSVQAGRPQSDHGPRARPLRRRGQAAVGKARS